METLAEFARRQVVAVRRERAPMPRPAGCKLVTALSAAGPAALAGIAVRDFLVELNGEPAAGLVDLEYYGAIEKSFTFYRRASHERVVVDTTGIDPGLELQATPEAIRSTFDPKQPDFEALLALWKARDFAGLAALAEPALRATGRATPVLALLAAAWVETGRIEQGGELAHEYLEEHSRKWTMDYAAVAFHASAVAAAARGEREFALELWESAWANEPFERTAQAIEKASGRRPVQRQPQWPGRAFPLDYHLPRLESQEPGLCALGDALGALGPGEVMVVCALDGYRVNGPYNRLLHRYLAWAPHFGPRLRAWHVVTEEAERPQGREALFRHEDKARAAGLPLTVLHDPAGELASAVGLPASPHAFVLDRAGQVLHEGELGGVALWDALARAS